MRLLPAIDLLEGRTVRLRKGDYSQEIRYDSDPAEVAADFAKQGASLLHVVDLEGARSGRPEQLDVLSRISQATSVSIEYGGGLRTIDDLRSAAAVGADRLVLGTAAISNPRLVDAALEEFGARLVVSVDGRGGMAATDGWTEESGERIADLFDRLASQGVTSFVYSAIESDGTLEGPALDELRSVSHSVRGSLSYAGGVGTIADLETIARARLVNVTGVIVGRAIHEGRFSVAEAIAALAG
jgi:phosphoribosylformimino-5-aminoimidazole carboxamide ribotide isomerase